MGHANCKHPAKHKKAPTEKAEVPAVAPLPKPKSVAARVKAALTGK